MSWSRVQGNNNDNSATATTLAVSLGAAVSSGSLVIITITWGAVTSPTPTVTDDKSNSYHLVPASQYSSNFNQGVAVYYLGNVTNGPTTFTATLHSSNQNGIIVEEFSGGQAAGDPIDGNAGQEQDALASTSADAITSGTFTTTANGDLLFGAELSTAQFPDAVGTGFTLGIQDSNSGAFIETEYKVQSASSSSSAATFTQNTGFNNWLTLGVAFKAGVPPFVLPLSLMPKRLV